jgi:hypothetical protein
MPRVTLPDKGSPGDKSVGCLIFLLLGVPILVAAVLESLGELWDVSAPAWVGLVLLGVVVGVGALAMLLSRLDIGPEGVTVRLITLQPRVKGLVRWHAIDTIILDQPRLGRRSRDRGHERQPPRLLVVPADGVDLGVPATQLSPLDARACVLLVSFNQIRASPDQVAQALARYGGRKFVDARPQHSEPEASWAGVPRFDIGLRGYDPVRVDELIQRAHAALRSANPAERLAVRSALESASASLPLATRGYDRTQVDAYLTAISADLASRSA